MLSYSDDSKLLSHPNKKLVDHLYEVAINSKNIFEKFCIEDNLFYSNISYLIGLCHDFAKSTSFFQKYLKGIENQNYFHGFLSAIFGYYVVKQYCNQEKYKNNIINFPILSYICIKRHHGDLKNIYGREYSEYNYISKNNIPDYILNQIDDLKKRNIDSFEDFYLNNSIISISIKEFLNDFDEIIIEIKRDLKDISLEKNLENYLLLLLFFSVLIDSDKFDASGSVKFQEERKDINSNIVDLYKKERFNNNENSKNDINKKREEAYNQLVNCIEEINLDDKIYSITLPTGAGKTLSAFSFALKLREKIKNEYNFESRIIYSLPFLSIIDQNEKVIEDIFLNTNDKKYLVYNKEKESYTVSSDIFIKHNSMSDIYYETPEEEEELSLNNSELLIEGWYSEIIITTLYQLLYTLISNKNKSLRKFHNIVNSIIIIDEVQTIPAKYWKLINVIFKKISEKFNIWFILMSATQPKIFNKNEIKPLIRDEEYFFNEFDRVNYVFHNDSIFLDQFKEDIIEEIYEQSDKSIMIVLNTINSSVELYKYIDENIDDSIELYYLSSNIIPKQRLKRINQINKSKNRKVIITTQLVEAGVDIDVDIIYRDFSIVDSIIQTAGRCNRNNKKEKGTVHIIKLKELVNEKEKYFSDYIYDDVLTSLTEELISSYDKISEKDFNHDILEDYYLDVKDRISQDNSNYIIKSMKSMNLVSFKGTIGSKEGMLRGLNEFKLIEEDYDKIDVFVEIDNEAQKKWNEYQKIKNNEELSKFNKKLEFKRIKNEFNKYIISVNSKEKERLSKNDNSEVYYIPRDDLKRKYDENIGFLSEEFENTFNNIKKRNRNKNVKGN